ncbi:hypothetical protein GCM10027515_26590 [Schumannella luteola]|uniref:DUF3168 domain-containing protein n=1 Tax=Schumannella luteola TaxID=472059 RepID=A0A852YE16_9MICO|nr:hypothetical protein [Schumannella luteola]NYG99544.1 hypothetical protein [Schumannella luteola]TPX03861.1 hypothetical protein FJ656_15125 [Schumannella luteola]
MSARKAVADAITKHLPKAWTIKPHLFSVDNLRQPVVMVETVEYTRATSDKGAPIDRLHRHDLVLHVLVAETAPEKRADAIESAADRVVEALEKVAQDKSAVALQWGQATFDVTENFPSADITVTTYLPHDYPAVPTK